MAKPDATRDIELIAYSVTQAAAAMGIDRERMGGLCRAGVVPHIRLGTRVVIGKVAFEQWLTQACWENADRTQPANTREPRDEAVPRTRRARRLREVFPTA